MADSCHVCALGALATTDDRVVYRDELWTAASPVAVPGWVMLMSNQHNEGVWELDEATAARFGPLAARLTGVLRDVCDAECVYMMYAGENALHFHALLMARGAAVPAEWRGTGLLDHHADLADPAEASRVLAAVREKLGWSPAGQHA